MDVKKSSEKRNPLLKRTEITFFLDHDGQGTPPLYEVRTAIASMYDVSDDLVYVLNLQTLAGTHRTVGEAEIYDPPGTTRTLLPQHIHRRNQPARGRRD